MTTDTDPGAYSRSKPKLSRIIGINLLVLCALFLLLELGWRAYLYHIGKGFFDDPHEFYSPFFTLFDEPSPFETTDSFWFYNGRVSKEKPANEIRIICFGGSTTKNWRSGISYTEFLEERINAQLKGYQARFLNAGGEGYTTAHTLVNFSLRNLDVHPDIITIYHNVNDLTAAVFVNQVNSDYAQKYLTYFYLGLRHREGIIAEISKLSRVFRFIVSSSYAIMYPTDPYQAHGDYKKGLIYFERNLHNIIAVARANGVRVLLTSQTAGSDLRAYEPWAAYNETVRKVAQQENVPFVDVANMVTGDELFLPDGVHNNREGVEAVANTLYPALAALVDEVRREREGSPNR